MLTREKWDLISNFDGTNTDRLLVQAAALPYAASFDWSSTPANQVELFPTPPYGASGASTIVSPYIDPDPTVPPVYGYPLITVTIGTPCGSFDAYTQVHVHCKTCKVRSKPAVGLVGGTHVDVYLGDSGQTDLSFAGTVAELYDSRDVLVGKGTFDASGKARIELEDVKAAAYTLRAYTDDGRQFDREWIVAPTGNSKLVLSPNPAVAGIDAALEGVVFGLADSLAPYEVTVTKPWGEVVYETSSAPSRFSIPTTTLTPGTYLVSVSSKSGGSWVDSVSVVLQDEPHLAVFPNPTSGNTAGSLENFVKGFETLDVTVVDYMGTVRRHFQADVSGFSVSMDGLPPGLYQLIANDGLRVYTLLVRKE